MKKKYIIAAAVVAALGGIGFGIWNFARSSEADGGIPRNAAPVQLEEARVETIRQTITARGMVELSERHLIYPKGQGRVSEVLVKRGDAVTAGQVIVRYDGENLIELNRQLTEANLALRAAELSLQSALLPASQAELAQARAGIIQAENAMSDIDTQISQFDLALAQMDGNISNAERAYESTRLLYERGAASRRELDTAFSELTRLRDQRAVTEAQRSAAVDAKRRAGEAVSRAEEQYQLVIARGSDPQVVNHISQQRLNVEQAKLRIDQIQHQIDRFAEEEISEHSGAVLELNIQPGETASAARPLMIIADVGAGNLLIRVNVPEAEAANLHSGQSVELRGAAFDEVYAGVVGTISPVVEEVLVNNNRMRVLVVEILPEAAPNLRSGYTVEAVITTRVEEDAVLVPLMSTLSAETGEDFVFIMRDDFSVERRVITTGGYSGMYIEAMTGVLPGERVVVNPPGSLADGAFVRPISGFMP